MSICWYLRVLPVLHRPEVVDIGVKSYIEKYAICLKDYRIRPFLSIRHAHGDLCKHLGIDHPDRYSNLFLNANINRHAHTEHLPVCFASKKKLAITLTADVTDLASFEDVDPGCFHCFDRCFVSGSKC